MDDKDDVVLRKGGLGREQAVAIKNIQAVYSDDGLMSAVENYPNFMDKLHELGFKDFADYLDRVADGVRTVTGILFPLSTVSRPRRIFVRLCLISCPWSTGSASGKVFGSGSLSPVLRMWGGCSGMPRSIISRDVSGLARRRAFFSTLMQFRPQLIFL